VSEDHATYNVLLPVRIISVIKDRASATGVSPAQVVRELLDFGLAHRVQRSGPVEGCYRIVKSIMQSLRDAYPLPKFGDGKTLGDQIASKIEKAYEKNKRESVD
jgi:hypothetical protein